MRDDAVEAAAVAAAATGAVAGAAAAAAAVADTGAADTAAARARRAAAAQREPRWTICIDGDAVEIALRPTASPWVWVPTILFIPAPLAMAWACAWLARWIVRYSFPLHGAYEVFGLVFGAGSLALAAVWCVRIAVKEMAWMLWIWTGLERTTVGPSDVRIDRDGAGIAKVVVFARTPGAPIEVARRPLLGDVLSFRWGLPRPGTYGALRVAAPGGRRRDQRHAGPTPSAVSAAGPDRGAGDPALAGDIPDEVGPSRERVRFGLDLTVAEAAAIVAEIDLIRGAGRGQCKLAN